MTQDPSLDSSCGMPPVDLLEATFESLGDALIIADPLGRVLRLNARAEDLLGWTSAGASGRPLREVFQIATPGASDAAQGLAERCAREGTVRGSADLTVAEGTQLAIYYTATAIRQNIGSPLGTVLVVREVENERPAGRAALLAIESKIHGLYDAGIIGVLVTTLQGRVIEINETLLEMVGYTREQVSAAGFSWRSLTPPEWHDIDERTIANHISQGIGRLREKEYVRSDGTRIPVMVGSAQLAAGSNDVIAFVVDLSGNREAATAVAHLRESRESEAKFRGLLETAPDAVVIVDRGGKIVLVNSQTERLFGYARAELIGQSVDMLVPDQFRPAHAAHRDVYFAAPMVRAMASERELYCVRKDGARFPVEITLSPLQSKDGLLVSGSIRDVTERKNAEEQRKRLAAIVESSGDAIISKTLDGIITTWNDAARRMFGYTAEEIVGKHMSLLIPPGREDEEPRILSQLRRGERIEQFETVRRRKDGRDLHISATSSPMRDANGNLIGASHVARDITERRYFEEALIRANDAANAASRELEAFSYSVAHDLRGPLRGMDGFAQLLVDNYYDKFDEEGRDWLGEIISNAHKMGALIDALLALARVTRSEPQYEWVDLSAIAHEVASRLAGSEPTRAVEWTIEDGMTAEVDPALARALLDNLLGNAWKFTSKQPVAKISFTTKKQGGAPVFLVRDNGAGFDMAFANKLFVPFQRLHTIREFAGTGIGLATANRIVHRHGGRIWAEGAVNEGAAFFFTLSGPRPTLASQSRDSNHVD